MMSINFSYILPSLYNIKILASTGQSYFSLILCLNLVFARWIRLFNFLDISDKIIEEYKFCGITLVFEFLFGNKFSLLIKVQIVSKDS